MQSEVPLKKPQGPISDSTPNPILLPSVLHLHESDWPATPFLVHVEKTFPFSQDHASLVFGGPTLSQPQPCGRVRAPSPSPPSPPARAPVVVVGAR